MAHVVLRDVSKAYAAVPVIEGVSIGVGHRERVGLIGRNGEGKTTLLRLMAGVEAPDAGQVEWAGGVTIGLLDQTRPLDFPGSIHEAMLAEFAELRAMEDELRSLERCMADPSLPEARGRGLDGLTRAYAGLTERFEAGGGYEYRTRVAQALTGLGFRQADFERAVAEFSGGERVRGALAKLLLAAPDLLLLDEPTNHLDLAATEWLEAFLVTYQGAIVVVSHDRYFLDRLVRRVAEVELGRLRVYDGNYTSYVALKEEELLRDATAAKALRERMGQLRDYVAKYSAGNRATQAKSKAKMLARLTEQAETIRRRHTDRPTFRFRAEQATGSEVLAVQHLTAEGGGKVLFSKLDFTVRSGDRLAILGPNGCGKTTLLRLLLGLESNAALGGEIAWGHGVQAGYLRQDLSDLDDSATVLQSLMDGTSLLPGEARNLLGGFQFRGDDVFKQVGDLSGGERCRLSMAILLVSGANVLVLDEPTNHLDVTARASLEDALAAYRGTVIFVSHDRYFVDRVASSVLVFEPERPRLHRGNFSSYRAAQSGQVTQAAQGTQAAQAAQGTQGAGRRRGGSGRAIVGTRPDAGVRPEVQALLEERAALEAEMAGARRVKGGAATGASSQRVARDRLARYREINTLLERYGAKPPRRR